MAGIVSWDDMAQQDLREASAERTVRREFLDLAASELRYPPSRPPDEGFAVQYDRGFAYRRALRRNGPSLADDLTADPNAVDSADQNGFRYGDYYYMYRLPTGWEVGDLGTRGRATQLVVARLLHISQMDIQLE
ncbi:hypothetical protein ACWGEU_11215 [Streptomyces goshikiensis]